MIVLIINKLYEIYIKWKDKFCVIIVFSTKRFKL